MIAMGNKAYERAVEVLAWMISSPTFLVEGYLDLGVVKAEAAMEAGGEEMIWYTL